MDPLSNGSTPVPSAPATPGGSKEYVGDYQLTGIQHEWDNCPMVRARMRTEARLLMHFDPQRKSLTKTRVEGNVMDLKVNKFVLKPVLVVMAQNQFLLPAQAPLEEEIKGFYDCASVPISNDVIYQESWGIRRCLQVAKRLARRKAYPKDSQAS